jgi:hypothetical protein
MDSYSTPHSTSQNTQSWIMDRMMALGYSPKGKGICYGLAILAMQAAIIGELHVFIKRLQLLKNIPVNELPDHMEKLKTMRLQIMENAKKEATVFYSKLSPMDAQKAENKLDTLISKITKERLNQLDEETKISLEIPNLLEAIAIGQSPEAYKEIFPEGPVLQQGTLLTTPLTQSPK